MSELTQFPLTTAAQMTAADWTAKNPVLEQFQMGVESDTGKTKVCMGPRTAWNSLDYWSPGGSGVQIVTATVQTNVGTKQALLAAVPTGKVRIVTETVARNASTSLAGIGGGIVYGFDVLASNVGGFNWDGTGLIYLTDDERYITGTLAGAGGASYSYRGEAGDVLGVIVSGDFGVTATLDIDVHYYDVDA